MLSLSAPVFSSCRRRLLSSWSSGSLVLQAAARGSRARPGAGAAATTAPGTPSSASAIVADDPTAAEDLTVLPTSRSATTPSPRQAPRRGSPGAWKQPLFAASTTNLSARAALQRGGSAQSASAGGGLSMDDDVAAIEHDIVRLSRIERDAQRVGPGGEVEVAATAAPDHAALHSSGRSANASSGSQASTAVEADFDEEAGSLDTGAAAGKAEYEHMLALLRLADRCACRAE